MFVSLLSIVCLSFLGAFVEMRFSFFQAHYFSVRGAGKRYLVGKSNGRMAFPRFGPYNERLGYVAMPKMLEKLEKEGAKIEKQASWTREIFGLWEEKGLSPPYREKTSAGLKIYNRYGEKIYEASYPKNVFASLVDVPEVVVKALLAIENREMFNGPAEKNPVIEWSRLSSGIFNSLLKKIGLNRKTYGASTLATQMEKFRHSPDGMTGSAGEKYRQMQSASYRAYMYGKDTRLRRKEIVLDYINSLPLGGIKGFGEVIGIGDGLEAWYGLSPKDVRECLAERIDPLCFKQALSLLMAQRRPYYYLVEDHGALNRLTEKYLPFLAKEGVISKVVADMAAAKKVDPRKDIKAAQKPIAKGVDAIRYFLLRKLGLKSLYELDRMDLSVYSTLDSHAQKSIEEDLKLLVTPEGAKKAGLLRFPLIGKSDPSNVVYSVAIWEQSNHSNLMRVNADTYQGRLDLNEGMKLELGSTAKLRTLVSYLQIVESLYNELKDKPKKELLGAVRSIGKDNIGKWMAGYLTRSRKTPSLKEVLDASLERKYSASPHEAFFTGGGIHTFSNYKKEENGRVPMVKEALWKSCNLAFIRIMRDVVGHLLSKLEKKKSGEYYLSRFIDKEGRIFLRQAYNDYKDLDEGAVFSDLILRTKGNVFKISLIFRLLWPEKDFSDYIKFLRGLGVLSEGPKKRIGSVPKNLRWLCSQRHYSLKNCSQYFEFFLYRKVGFSKAYLSKLVRYYEQLETKQAKDGRLTVGGFDWQDYGWVVKFHPLRLWLGTRIISRGYAPFSQLAEESGNVRQEIYRWLNKPKLQAAREMRIRIMREEDAFSELHKMWKGVGFPFSYLQPSLATAIGSSGDRPSALARLVGIILSGGYDYPRSRITEIRFAEGTPYETVVDLFPEERLQRVLSKEVAETAKETMTGVFRVGTAYTLKDLFGGKVVMGGKTGTGDNRRETYTRRGAVTSSKAINRTATFVFFAGNMIGVVTAHVPGEKADKYNFTSALPVRLVKIFEEELAGLLFNGKNNK